MTVKTAHGLTNDYVAFLRKHGLKVTTIPGWNGRGRPGSFAAVGQLNHHTGSSAKGWSRSRTLSYCNFLFVGGRDDLPAPLCQGAVAPDGEVFIGASERANHAGKAKRSGPIGSGDGNTLYFGWEHMNNGTEGWPKAQYEAMVLLNALTAIYFGWGADRSRAHKETSITGKWDPGGLFMPRFRDDIAAAIRGVREPKMNHVQLGNIDLIKAEANLSAAIDHYDDTKKSRTVVWRELAKLKAARVVLRLVIRTMPPK